MEPYLYRIAVRRITMKVLADYVPWRFATSVKAPPSPNSLAIDYEAIRRWLAWCVDQGMRRAVPEFGLGMSGGALISTRIEII